MSSRRLSNVEKFVDKFQTHSLLAGIQYPPIYLNPFIRHISKPAAYIYIFTFAASVTLCEWALSLGCEIYLEVVE